MCSKMGHRTIAQFIAFRTGFNAEEIEAGLIQANSNGEPVDECKYPNVRAKVFTNMVQSEGEDKDRDPSVVISRDMIELRKELN